MLKYFFNYSIYIFIVIIFFNTESLLSMNFLLSHEGVMEVIVMPYLGHNDICSLALVNKACNALVRKTIVIRKNYLKNYVNLKNVPSLNYNLSSGNNSYAKTEYIKHYKVPANVTVDDTKVTWHSNGSAFTFIERYESSLFSLGLVFLADCYAVKKISFSSEISIMHQWPTSNEPARFNSKGNAYIYGINKSNCFVEYALSTKNEENSFTQHYCHIHYQESNCPSTLNMNLQHLTLFLNFPKILHAVLNSNRVHEELLSLYLIYKHSKGIKGKVYWIEDVVFPDDYKHYKEFKEIKYSPFMPTFMLCKDFNKIYCSMRRAIEQRYKHQHCSALIEVLPKIVMEKIGSLIKRVGRDTIRCVSKACNELMWSQDELNNKLIQTFIKPDEDKPFYEKCGAWENPFLELKDVIKHTVPSIRLVQWLMKKGRAHHPFHQEECAIIAARVGNLSVVEYFFNKSDYPKKMIYFLVKEAASCGHNSILEYLCNTFEQAYFHEGYLKKALELAKKNGHVLTCKLIEDHLLLHALSIAHGAKKWEFQHTVID